MKLQDVLLKAMAKKVSSMEAAEIAGVTDRTMRRIRERYQEFGYTGLFDQRRGMRSIHRVPMETAEEVLRLYREVYFDLNIRHFHEKLRDEHAIGLSYTWVQQALQGAGLVAKRAAPAAATAPTNGREDAAYRRQQTPLATGDQWHDLIVILDDATSEIYYAQLVVEESTRTVMEALREVIETRGLFCSLYSDRGSHFFVTQKAGDKVDKHRLTQVGRAMKELGVQMIAAYSPQARGRSERSFGTWQGRLPQELRLAQATTVEGANQFLRDHYIGKFNAQFAVAAQEKGTAFRRTSRTDLNWIFTVQTERVVAKDNTVAIGDRSWQIGKTRFRHTLAGSTVTVHEHLDGGVSIRFGPHVVGRFAATGESLTDSGERRGKGGAWKPAKTNGRFPPVPPLPWKSRNCREIPTFPPRRRRRIPLLKRKSKGWRLAPPKTQTGQITC